MAAPYLRAAETELDLSEGTRLQAGQQWDNELPAMIKAADQGSLQLLWVGIS